MLANRLAAVHLLFGGCWRELARGYLADGLLSFCVGGGVVRIVFVGIVACIGNGTNNSGMREQSYKEKHGRKNTFAHQLVPVTALVVVIVTAQ